MSTNLADSNPETCAASDPMTPQSITSRDAWNTPIFTIPAVPEREPVLEREPVPEREPVLECKPVPKSKPMPEREPMLECERATSAEPPQRPGVETAVMSVETLSAGFTRGETSRVWGLQLDRVDMDQAMQAIDDIVTERTPRYIITANLNYAMLLDRDASLQAVTDDASLVLADGQPLVWRSSVGSAGRLPERVAGSELIYRIAERAADCGWRIYFLGAEAGVAQRCADTLAERYPGLQVAGVQSPPYRSLSEPEQLQLRQGIIDSRADILLVAFGQPKGERWIHQHYQALGVPLSIQVGASFDFVAGTAKRAPLIWQRLGLEWFHRMLSDPGRLVPRYGSNAWFMFLSLIRDWRDYVDDRFGDSAAGQTRA